MELPSDKYESRLKRRGFQLIAGTDEAGRGAWAGPLVGAAVILPPKYNLPGLRDSKQLNGKQRDVLFSLIVDQAVSYAIYKVSNKMIDRHGLTQANNKALINSVKKLRVKPEAVLIDGWQLSISRMYCQTVIKGDVRVLSIAAASILAKVFRDRLMCGYARRFPSYGFSRHKGYGTAYHLRQLKKLGPTDLHRKSFAPLRTLG